MTFYRYLYGLIGIAIAGVMLIIALPLPDPLFPEKYAMVITDREGDLIGAAIAEDGQWRFPQVDTLPEKFVQALLTFEDAYFYQHPGINPVSMWRAFAANRKAGRIVRGGSTITMQLARMIRRNPPRTYMNKMYETLLAIKLELVYSKDELLTFYINNAPFGGNVVGMDAASWRYFGRPSYQLSWAEAAGLAVLPNSPSLVKPGYNKRIYREKRDHLLEKLSTLGYLDASDLLLAKAEHLPGKPKRLPENSWHLLKQLQALYPGSRLKTTISKEIQNAVYQITKEYSNQLMANQVYNAAVLVTEVETGNVIAYVGNVPSDKDHGQDINMVMQSRSTGSLLKPVLYAIAMDEGLITPGQLLPDIPLFYRGFTPKNFDKTFHGAVAANRALQASLNVPNVYLLKKYGYEKFHHKLTRMGLSNSLKYPAGHYGLSMIIGGVEASLWDITGMYGSMARVLSHYHSNPFNTPYTNADYHPNRILLNDGEKSQEETNFSAQSLIGAGALYQTFETLKGLQRPEEDAQWQQFSSTHEVVWKTGTSQGFRDAWAIGLNSAYVVGIWLGNADNEGRPGLTGIRAAAPLLFRIFNQLTGGADFEIPLSDMTQAKLCIFSGMKAGPYCEETQVSYIPKRAYRETGICLYHQNLLLDSLSNYRVTSACYPVNKMIETPWFILPPGQAWYYQNFHPEYQFPPDYGNGCRAENSEVMDIIYPKSFSKVAIPREITGKKGRLIVHAVHNHPGAKLFWYLDEHFLGSTLDEHKMQIDTQRGWHRVLVIDEQGRERQVVFEAI